jgi:pyrroloquinoline quinone biosynthesis protein D
MPQTTAELAPGDVPFIPARCRMQWEPAQQSYVLLFPEGMVKLSETAAEIMKRVDGANTVDAIVRSLEQAYPGADLRADVVEFLKTSHARGWIKIQGK